MELSVLDRQRAMLRRIYQTDSSNINQQVQLHHHHHSYSVVSDGDNSSVIRSQMPIQSHADWQCNSSFPNRQGNPNKRKAEIDIEEEGAEKSEITTKTERETSANASSKASEVEKPDYIHVRARRGQATDSHSLAERARREKISKKMKCLQDLVPGCNKVTGKAGMLDEIINYVQSLQKQVEFLSMKLAAVNPRLDFSMDNIVAKEIPAYIASLAAATTAQFDAFHYNPGSSNCGLPPHLPMDQSHILLQKPATSSSSTLPIPQVFLDPPSVSQLSGWEPDWESSFTSGFHQI